MPLISELTTRVKTHYDRISAFLTLVVLLVSLVYLAVHVGLAKRMQQEFGPSGPPIPMRSPCSPTCSISRLARWNLRSCSTIRRGAMAASLFPNLE